MAIDNLTINIITKKMQSEMISSRFGKAFALSHYDFALPYTCLEEKGFHHGTFIFSLNPNNPFLTYSYDRYEKVEDNTPFFNSLKKLNDCLITDIIKLQGERIITFKLSNDKREISDLNESYDFILEMFPNHPNAYIIAYPYGKIVSLYKEKIDIEKGLFVTRNVEYTYPPKREILNDKIETLEECKKYLSNNLYHYLSKYIEQGHDLKSSLTELLASDDLYINGQDLLPFSFDIKDIEKINPQDIYSHFVKDQKKIARLTKEKELQTLLAKAIKVAQKKLKNLQIDLKNAQDSLIYMQYGQMIYLYQSEIKKGDKVLKKDGLEIPLDPLLSVSQNANRYFKKYNKAKAALIILSDLIEKTKYEVLYLQKKELEAKDGTPRDILELKAELIQEGYIKLKQGKKASIKVRKDKVYQPHYLVLEQGKIGFGMNGLQNETLTFKIAKKDDLFIHVKDYPGSHIIIMEGKDDPEVLLIACELALYLSHLQDGTVYITEKKNVKKNSEKVGLVNLLKYETKNIRGIREESLKFFKDSLKIDIS